MSLKKQNLRRRIHFIFILFISLYSFNHSYGQVGIGTTLPDASSLLQVDDGNGNKGILIPQIALTATNVSSPVTSPMTSLLVYNTATNGTGLTAVTPGYYYWDSVQWVKLLSTAPRNMEYIYNGVDSISITTLDTQSNGGIANLVIDDSGSFTLTQQAFIQVNYSSGFTISTLSGSAIDNEKAKLIRNRLNIYDISSGSDVLIERGGHDSVSYTNESAIGSVTIGGFFNNSGSTTVLLDPGTYRIDLEAIIASNLPNNGTVSDAFRTQWVVENFKIIASY